MNQAGLDFYSRLVDGLLAAGITPFATLYHWDLPQALQDAGGWPSRATAEAFVEYADVVSRALGDRVKHWITHNEPWCASILSYQIGEHAPGWHDWPAALAAAHHVLLSHGWAVPVLRAETAPAPQVGITLNFTPATPASASPEDIAAARRFDGFFNRWFADPLYRGAYPDDMVAAYTAEGHLPAEGLPFVQAGDLAAIARADRLPGRQLLHAARSSAAPTRPATQVARRAAAGRAYRDGLGGLSRRAARSAGAAGDRLPPRQALHDRERRQLLRRPRPRWAGA